MLLHMSTLFSFFASQLHVAYGIPHPQTRMVNGIPVRSNDHPWMVSLRGVAHYENYITEYSFCGGSLISISPPVILTAAHCIAFHYNDNGEIVDSDDGEIVDALFADINRTYPNHVVAGDTFTTLAITSLDQFVAHPQYDDTNVLAVNDIGLVLFPVDSSVSDALSRIDILPQIPSQIAPNEACCDTDEEFTAMGYGAESTNGPPTYTLEKATLKYVKGRQCFIQASVADDRDEAWETMLDRFTYFTVESGHDKICVLGNGTNICFGDSGGPLLREDTDSVQIVGVASSGTVDCEDGLPSVFTSTGHFHDWVRDSVHSTTIRTRGTQNRAIANTLDVVSIFAIVLFCIQ